MLAETAASHWFLGHWFSYPIVSYQRHDVWRNVAKEMLFFKPQWGSQRVSGLACCPNVVWMVDDPKKYQNNIVQPHQLTRANTAAEEAEVPRRALKKRNKWDLISMSISVILFTLSLMKHGSLLPPTWDHLLQKWSLSALNIRPYIYAPLQSLQKDIAEENCPVRPRKHTVISHHEIYLIFHFFVDFSPF